MNSFLPQPLLLRLARFHLSFQTEATLQSKRDGQVFVAHGRDARAIVATDVDATELEERIIRCTLFPVLERPRG